MRISDWSSDVCSSDLFAPARQRLQSPQRLGLAPRNAHPLPRLVGIVDVMGRIGEPLHLLIEPGAAPGLLELREHRSEEHTSELQSLMRISYAVFCLKKTTIKIQYTQYEEPHKTQQQTINHATTPPNRQQP